MRSVGRHRWLKVLGAALLGAASPAAVFAQTQWTGVSTTSWQDGASWTAGVPNAGTDATVTGGALQQPTLNATANVATLTQNAGTITLNGQTLNATTVNLNGGTTTGASGGGTVSAATFNLVNNGAFLTSATVNATNFSVSGGTLNGTSAVTATDVNLTGGIYGGSTTISASGTITLNSSSAFFNSSFQGTAGVTAAANTVLTNDNSYSGTTTINAGVLLQLGVGGTTGSFGTGNVVNNSGNNIVINRSGTLTISGAISGATGIAFTAGGGTLILTGDNIFGGGILVTNGGTVQVGNGGGSGTLGTGTVTAGSGTTLTFNRNNAFTVANVINGAGGVTQAGSGTTTLTGNNAYSGATNINAGVLQLGDGGTLGNGAGTVTLGGTGRLSFNSSSGNTLTVNNVIAGAGTVRQDGAGTTLLGAANTYSGTTQVNAGRLQLGTGASLNSTATLNVTGGTFDLNGNSVTVAEISGTGGTIALGSGGTLTTGTVSAGAGTDTVISGDGNFTLAATGGADSFGLRGDNTYTGTTTITSGQLVVGNGGLSGTLGTGNVVNNDRLSFSRSDTLTVANAISGSGTVTQSGSGLTILSGNNSYSGTTTISAGTLQVGDGGTTGSLGDGTGAVTNNAALVFNRSNTLTVANAIGGSGTLAQNGIGTTVLTGANNYGGITTINAGTLQIGSGGTTGTLGAGGVTNNAALVFNRSNPLSVSNAISGSGSVTQAGTGTTTLSGASSYTGGTIVNAGTLQLGASNALAASGALTVNGGTFALANFSQSIGAFAGAGGVTLGSGTLTVGDATSTVFSGSISGSGGLVKQGSGMLTLGGTNAYTGTTAINAGILAVNGSIAGNATVSSGATLQGTGMIGGNVTVAGTVAPGNSIGTLTIGGNYTQTGTYAVEVNPAGQSDRINITGTATLTGGNVSVLAQSGRYQRSTTYTILSATGGLVGTYSGVTSNFAFLTPSLRYSSTAVMLTLLASANSFQSGGQTPNQRAVGAALDLASPNATGDFATVLNAIYALDTTQGPRALDTIGGQNYSGFSSLTIQGAQLFMDSFQFQAGGGQGANAASLPGGRTYVTLAADCTTACDVDPQWGAWGSGVGAFGTVAGDANANGITYNLGGFVAGIDRRFGNNFRAGVATGYNAASLYTQNMPGYGSSNTLQFAVYGEFAQGPFYLDTLAGYAHSDNRMSRPIAISGLPFRTAQGYTAANTFFGQLEAGYKVVVASTVDGFVTPFARLQAVTSTQQGFSETGADSLNLSVAAQTTQSLRTVLGAQVGAALDGGWREKLKLVLRLGWSHEFADLSRPVTASFAGAPALGFTTFGATAPRDGVIIGFGASTAVGERTSVYFRYDGDLAGANTNHMLTAGVRYVW